jgi:hypothetical protein
MQDSPLSAHRAHLGSCRPHFRFELAQALQAFDCVCFGIFNDQISCYYWQDRLELSAAEIEEEV